MKLTIELELPDDCGSVTDEALASVARGLENLRGRWSEIPTPRAALFDENEGPIGSIKVTI